MIGTSSSRASCFSERVIVADLLHAVLVAAALDQLQVVDEHEVEAVVALQADALGAQLRHLHAGAVVDVDVGAGRACRARSSCATPRPR